MTPLLTDSWRRHLVESDDGIRRLLETVRTIAVLGIKTEAQADQPAFYVPRVAQEAGYAIIPVPVYYPDARIILGEPVVRSLAAIAPPPDMVNLFRRPEDVTKHIDEILACHPKVVWMQLGIRNEAAAEAFARAGIDVVQDRCLKVEIARLRASTSSSQGELK